MHFKIPYPGKINRVQLRQELKSKIPDMRNFAVDASVADNQLGQKIIMFDAGCSKQEIVKIINSHSPVADVHIDFAVEKVVNQEELQEILKKKQEKKMAEQTNEGQLTKLLKAVLKEDIDDLRNTVGKVSEQQTQSTQGLENQITALSTKVDAAVAKIDGVVVGLKSLGEKLSNEAPTK